MLKWIVIQPVAALVFVSEFTDSRFPGSSADSWFFGEVVGITSSARMVSSRDSTPATACCRREPHREVGLGAVACEAMSNDLKAGDIVFVHGGISFL